MTETLKSILLVAVAAGVVAAAWLERPDVPGRGVVDDKGEPFFEGFDDPLAAAALEIVEFDEETGTARAFEVARHDGVWSLPSHENYPADAENQFAEATAQMIGLTKGSARSDSPADHELYGVVDPADAGPGATGVGMRVTITGENGRALADLIIGKEVKDSPGQRYVRLPGVDRVYLCAIDAEKFSTDFGEWIEKDLLELEAADIRKVIIDDYSIDEINRRLIQGESLELEMDSKSFQWSMPNLAEGETLISNKLTALRRALDDLKIVDVLRKPAGLSSELRTVETMQLDAEAVRSLQSRGYFIVQNRLLSNEGETIIQTKDGIQYNLRFGEIALTQGGGDEEDGEGESDTGRYLFVTAQCNPDLIPPPELVEVPDLGSLGIDVQNIPGAEDEETQRRIDEGLEQARVRAEQENQAKQAEHEQKIEACRKRADELNARFADWYYVISDSVYRNIRLRRSDVVEKAEPEEPETPG